MTLMEYSLIGKSDRSPVFSFGIKQNVIFWLRSTASGKFAETE